jgi:hypothetical protein
MASADEYCVLVFARVAEDELRAEGAIRGLGSAHAMSLVSQLSTGAQIAVAIPQLPGSGKVVPAALANEIRLAQVGECLRKSESN